MIRYIVWEDEPEYRYKHSSFDNLYEAKQRAVKLHKDKGLDDDLLWAMYITEENL